MRCKKYKDRDGYHIVQIFNIEDNPPGMTFPPDKGLLVQTRKLELILGWFESFIFIFSQDLSDLVIVLSRL